MPPRRRASASNSIKRKASSDSDFEEPATKKSRKAKNIRQISDDEYGDEQGDLKATVPHPVSLHAIKNPQPLRAALLDWYAGVHETRSMPWRKVYDANLGRDGRAQRAYEVWISEIMLQQTQVATVIPYYNRWIAKFPTIRDLAASDIETVNGLWKGLGYYSRAARLLSGAKKVVADHDGRLPDNAKDMMAHVPGVGRYSAGAICSIAYNQCEPILDGNVNRLLSRVLALHASPKAKPTLDILWAGASALVEDAERPGDLNQALIELGSTVCRVRDPACGGCPLKVHCAAYNEAQGVRPDEGDIEELCGVCEPSLPGSESGVMRYPMKAERKKAREETDVVSVVEWRGEAQQRWFLLVRRPEKGLLAGLHEFPTSPDVAGSPSPSQLKKIAHDQLASLLTQPPPPYKPATNSSHKDANTEQDDLRIAHIRPAGDILHVFSHIRKTYRVQWVLLRGPGGDEPPSLSSGPELSEEVVPLKAKKKAGAGKAAADLAAPCLRWVREEDVVNANIGTGVMKVWKRVKEMMKV